MLRSIRGGVYVVLALALPAASACNNGAYAGDSAGTGGSGGVAPGAGVGADCTSQACRSGLSCQSGVCALGHSIPSGSPCTLGGECATGLQCLSGTCAAAGDGAQGDSCRGDGDCQQGLRCGVVGFSAQCQPEGTGDVGKDCVTSGDCFAGLACTVGKCEPVPPGAPSFGAPTWTGVSCDPPTTDTVRAFFEVPGANPPGQDGDFFRLPFPNDIRIKSGKIDLTGFPTPGNELLGYDPVQRYLDAVMKDDHAWGTYPTVIFRFSGAVDYTSLKGTSSSSPVNWIDVTAGAPEYGRSSGLSWYASGGRTNYVCDNWLGIRRPQGAPLVPGHTYAVWLTTAVLDAHGKAVQRSEHMTAMLAAKPPSDAVLAGAYAAFKPLRDYLGDKGIDPTLILDATVVTAGTVRDTMRDLATAVEAAPVPTAKSWVKCAAGVTSPCPQHDGNRNCGGGDPAYDEYEALVSLPIFQQGTAPYSAAPDGRITTQQPVRSEDVCMALTVPKGTMPATGWPLVVFAHGTGGSFRDHIRPEVAGALSKVTLPDNSTVQFAVLGIDQVEHGPRRGSSTASPNDLFFNFANPDAARGNPLQGAADQISLARFGASLDVTAAETGGDAIKIDPGKIVFFGHSQGSTEGSVMLPYADEYKGAVLSGNGASLMDALLDKTKPVNVAAAVPFVLGDYDSTGGLAGGNMHPVLTILQQWVDPADPLNYAWITGQAPVTGHAAKSVFQTYGLGDSYAPPATLATYALAGGLDVAAADSSVTKPDAIGGLVPKPVPVSGTTVTLAVREYAPPSGKDGHFVVFDVPSANQDAVRFLGMIAAGQVPQVGK